MSNKANIVIKQNNRVFDVFTGEEGWGPEQWTRYIVVNVGRSRLLKYLKGVRLSAEIEAYVMSRINDGKLK